jgi:cobalt-zinc-cadmium efflux system protein
MSLHEHTHSHSHHHAHDSVFHVHAPIGKMKTAFVLTWMIFVVEVIGGWLSHSLALLSDAGHVITDLAAIGLSLYAMNQAKKPSNERMTFGYYRAGILAALINGITLIVIALIILFEAYGRFLRPEPVASTWMFASAGVGLIVNLFLGLGLSKEDNINVRSAMLHMLGDAAASAGVIVGGIVIRFTGWYIVDPLLSVLIALLIAFGAWNIVKQTIHILMEGTPHDIPLQRVATVIQSVDGVSYVHDLHVWSIASGKHALSCHVVIDGDLNIRESQAILRDIEHKLVHLGIGHVTIQMEDADHPHGDSMLCHVPDTVGHRH